MLCYELFDAYLVYHQIHMNREDGENMAFITKDRTFFYKKYLSVSRMKKKPTKV